MDLLNKATEVIHDTIGLPTEVAGQILWTLIVVLVGLGANKVLIALINRHADDASKQYSRRKGTSYLLGFIIFVLIFWI